jgi:hypothetical protein
MQRGGEAALDHGRCSAHEVCTVCAPSPSRAGTRAPSPPARGPTPTTTQRRPTLHTSGTRGRELRGRPAMRSEIECATAARQTTYTRAPSCARAPRAACPATWAEAGKGRCWHAHVGRRCRAHRTSSSSRGRLLKPLTLRALEHTRHFVPYDDAYDCAHCAARARAS